MALPMVHLLAAWSWAQDKPELRASPDYYLGAISPDAIHVRDGDDKSHKNEIHLNNWRAPDPDAVLAYWREHHAPFDIGYGVHVLLDGQWAAGFRRDFPQMLLPSGRPDPEIYYNDTCVTDFALYHSSPLTPFLMEMLRQGRASGDHPLLRRAEFEQWREDTLAFYRRECPMRGEVRYLSEAYVRRFLAGCQELMNETYYKLNLKERMPNMNETQKSILERRSNRGFSDVALSQEQTQNLVDAALASPTACNYQDWHFIFVTDRALLKEYSDEYRAILLSNLGEAHREKNRQYDLFFNAPLVVFITLPRQPRSRFAEVDAGIAVQNLALSAQGMGLGSVILGRPKEVLTGENGAQWETRLGFAADHRFAIAIAIGHPTMTKEAHPIGENKISFVKG